MSNDILKVALREALVDAVREEVRTAVDDAVRGVIGERSDRVGREATVQLLRLMIDGVEVTQAIQYRSAAEHLTDPTDRGRDNGIALVANKPALVRVYVRSLLGRIYGVTATVMFQRRRYGVWRDFVELAQTGRSATVAELTPDFAAERSQIDDSLNFLIPAALMRGHARLRVRVSVPDNPQLVHEVEEEINASLQQTLRIRGIPVQYWGPDAAGAQVKLAAPGLADFQRTAALMLRMYPVSQSPDITLGGLTTIGAPLTGNMANGDCPTSWIDLVWWIAAAKYYDGNRADRLYYGLLPNGIPIGDTGGCGGGGAAGSGFIDDGMGMAHELGHVLGLAHAPGCLPADDLQFDQAYPAYEPYDTVANKVASIGEYGTDVTKSTIYSPRVTSDFMSYCGTKWISLYNYQKLLPHPMLDPQWVSDPKSEFPAYLDDGRSPYTLHPPKYQDADPTPPWMGRRMYERSRVDQAPLIVLSGFLSDGVVEMRRVIRVVTGPTRSGRVLDGMFAELRDEEDRLLCRAPVRSISTRAGGGCGAGCGCGGCTDGPSMGLVEAILPDPGAGTVLRLVSDSEVIWSRTAPAFTPTVSAPVTEVCDDQLIVRWTTQASDEFGIERVVRWSADDGRSWQVLALGLREDEAVVPLSLLSAGPVLLQVHVSDGFHGVSGDAVAIEVPCRAPEVAILWPAEGATVRTDASVRLWGIATASDGRAMSSVMLHWELDGESVGEGTELWAELPEWEGEHRVTLRVHDGERCATASVIFLATCSGHRPYQIPRG